MIKVLFPKYFNLSDNAKHAVIIDRDYNVVHDPNSAYRDLYIYLSANLLRMVY